MTEEPSDRCCVVGLGYVGLTLAIHFDRAGYETVGYDVDERKIAELRAGRDPISEFGDETIAESDVSFTAAAEQIEGCDYVLAALPTPIDERGTPDLSVLEAACETIGRHISDETVVVFESTVYPGATRERLRPAVERGAAEQGGATFSVGYSPERIVPSSRRSLSEVTKIVSAEDERTLAALGELYDDVVDAGVHLAETIETAEASKCLENVQRDVNIALVNEFAMGCRHLDFELDPHAVLDAATTKWNFHGYEPGIVGGHCIPVDPHYLRYAFEEAGFTPRLLRHARTVNQQMVNHVCSITADALRSANVPAQLVRGSAESAGSVGISDSSRESVAGSRVMLLGFGYKPDTSDVRNSGVVDVADEFRRMGLEVSGYDPFHDASSVPESYDFEVMSRLEFDGVDAVVMLTPHDELRDLDLEVVSQRMNDNPVLVDVGNAFDPRSAREQGFTYRRL